MNPGNVRPRSGAWWPGQVALDTAQPDPPYCKFGSAKAGFDCLASVLIGYASHGTRTPRSIIGVWAPAGDGNAPSAYAASVAGALRVTVDTALNLHDPTTLHALAVAIAHVEAGAGSWWTDVDIVAGIVSALARVGASVPAAPTSPPAPAHPAPPPTGKQSLQVAGQPGADALDAELNPGV